MGPRFATGGQQPAKRQALLTLLIDLHRHLVVRPADPAAAGALEQVQLHWKESAADLEQSIALRPTFAEAHYRLSRAYAHLGRREDAQREIALHQTYSQQAKDSLNARMQEVMTFILKPS